MTLSRRSLLRSALSLAVLGPLALRGAVALVPAPAPIERRVVDFWAFPMKSPLEAERGMGLVHPSHHTRWNPAEYLLGECDEQEEAKIIAHLKAKWGPGTTVKATVVDEPAFKPPGLISYDPSALNPYATPGQ